MFRRKVNLRTALKAEAFGAGGFAARLSGCALSPIGLSHVWFPSSSVSARLRHALRAPLADCQVQRQAASGTPPAPTAISRRPAAKLVSLVVSAGRWPARGARRAPLPQIDLSRFTPQFFHVCLSCECNSVRGLCKRLSRHKPRLSSPCRHFVPQGSPAAIYSTSASLRVVTTFPTSLCKAPEPNSFIHTANVKKLGRKKLMG